MKRLAKVSVFLSTAIIVVGTLGFFANIEELFGIFLPGLITNARLVEHFGLNSGLESFVVIIGVSFTAWFALIFAAAVVFRFPRNRVIKSASKCTK